jgi:hypothetical protein
MIVEPPDSSTAYARLIIIPPSLPGSSLVRINDIDIIDRQMVTHQETYATPYSYYPS